MVDRLRMKLLIRMTSVISLSKAINPYTVIDRDIRDEADAFAEHTNQKIGTFITGLFFGEDSSQETDDEDKEEETVTTTSGTSCEVVEEGCDEGSNAPSLNAFD